MKKLLIITNLFSLSLVAFNACHKIKDDQSTNTGRGFCADSSCFTDNATPLMGLIDYRVALKMSHDYADDDGKRFVWKGHTRTGEEDARSIWFDIKRLKKFIGFIESSLCRDSCIKTDGYGIRVYFARYPDAKEMQSIPDLHDVPLEYANHHTVFMVPTFWDRQHRQNVDFDPRVPARNCKLSPLDSTTKEIFLQFAPAANGSGQEQNHGSLMPPPAGRGGTLPTPAN